MRIKNEEFNNETIVIDYTQYIGCTFNNCKFIYYGAPSGGFNDCSFNTIKAWDFGGEALNTIEFMRATYHGIGEGGKKMMENYFNYIKNNPPK